MHEQALRNVLLIQAIEESDPAGEVLPLADRSEATRLALRSENGAREASPEQSLTPAAERFLARRAERLRERLEVRSPFVRQVLALAGGATWFGPAVLALALVAGVALSVLDGVRRIDVLAFPLLGLILWNLVVYVVVLVGAVRSGRAAAAASGLRALYEGWVGWRARTLLRRSARFNAPLAAAMRRFAAEWGAVARPLLALRAARLFHLAAALVALGLIAGLYVRGIALRYEAGWESTFLGVEQVRTLLELMYGPAAAISGIALPRSPEALRALAWERGGGEAAPWIHLIAITAVLYIVLPRLALAGVTTLLLWRQSRRPAAPASMLPYARGVLLGTGGVRHERVSVLAYAYAPGSEAAAGLEALLGAALGAGIRLELHAPVRYGEEEELEAQLAGGTGRTPDWNVLVMSLAATPEAENHGVIIAALRDHLARAGSPAALLVLIDESSYAARMQGDAGLEQRLEERRRAWREFVAGYGLTACIVDLSRGAALAADLAAARETVRGALWTAQR